MPKPMIVCQAGPASSDKDLEPVEIYGSDLLHTEKTFRGFTMQDVGQGKLTMVNVYRIVFVALRRKSKLPPDMTLSQFEDTWEVTPNPPARQEQQQSDDGDEPDADPTIAAA